MKNAASGADVKLPRTRLRAGVSNYVTFSAVNPRHSDNLIMAIPCLNACDGGGVSAVCTRPTHRFIPS